MLVKGATDIWTKIPRFSFNEMHLKTWNLYFSFIIIIIIIIISPLPSPPSSPSPMCQVLILAECGFLWWVSHTAAAWVLISRWHSTVRCRYNAVNFLPNPHKIHPIARPLGRGMGCTLWVQIMIYTLPHSLQWCRQYHVILGRVRTALNCSSKYWQC